MRPDRAPKPACGSMTKKRVRYRGVPAKCQDCGTPLYHDDNQPVGDDSNVGDYNWICYPCQFRRMDNGTWRSEVERHLMEDMAH